MPKSTPSVDAYGLSDDKNILVFSLDGIPRAAVSEVMNDNPELYSMFGDFLFYDKVVSSSPATSASTATSLYGNKNFKIDNDTDTELWNSAPKNLLTNLLSTNGFNVSTFDIYSRNSIASSSKILSIYRANHDRDILNLLNYSIARTLTNIYVIRGKPKEGLEKLASILLSENTDNQPGLIGEFSRSVSPEWKRPLLKGFLDYEKYVANLRISGTKPTAHFVHFTHTHYPVEFDRNCNYRGIDKGWFESRQNYTGVKEEVYCALTQYSNFIAKIRELGVYENSLIVLKSDHGKPVGYSNQSAIESFKINSHEYWGFDRYAAFLAIKDFGAGAGVIANSDQPVVLDDLAKTLCIHSQLPISCDIYPGYDLLDKKLSIPDEATVTLYVPESASSTYIYDTHIALTIPRHTDILQNLHAALSRQFLTETVGCSKVVEIQKYQSLDNGRTDNRSWLMWSDKGRVFLRFLSDPGCPWISIDFQVARDADAVAEYRVQLNGQNIDAKIEYGNNDQNNTLIELRIRNEMRVASQDIVIEIGRSSIAGITVDDIVGFEIRTTY
jgi:hypothetical protein